MGPLLSPEATAWSRLQQGLKDKLNVDNLSRQPFRDISRQQVIDSMQFPIGHGSVDMDRVNTFGAFDTVALNLQAALRGYSPDSAIAAYEGMTDQVSVNPRQRGKVTPRTLGHEFRHRDNSRSPFGRTRKHEQITALDMLEAQGPEEYRDAAAYNSRFRSEESPDVLRGDGLIDYLNEQKDWIVKDSGSAAWKQNIPLRSGETYTDRYGKLFDKLSRKVMTNKAVWPKSQKDYDRIQDPDFRRYLQQKVGISEKWRKLRLELNERGRLGKRNDALTRPGPTQAKWDWEQNGVYKPR